MALSQFGKLAMTLLLCAGLAACGNRERAEPTGEADDPFAGTRASMGESADGSTLWDAFDRGDEEQIVYVNRYLWNASLDILNFLPIQTVDPFTGIIVTGYGTPPGGGRAYRATIHVTDPALEARALRVSLQTRNGPVAAGTARAVEDAILARARQMRIEDNRF